ncbi:MAG: hypothetical protein HQM10_08470 [Candidatus Riflebacteria bacterium]|nr:hypothetical protein [Candidatus Riflebacteria bacterium]
MLRKMYNALLLLFFVLAVPSQLLAAIGCTLNNPAQDLKYLFPDVTSFKEEIKEFRHLSDGKNLYENLKVRLGSDLDPVYESFDTPYTVYSVFKNKELIGLVHGVNIPGQGGVIQVFLSISPSTGEIVKFFFQRLESSEAGKLKNKNFREMFHGLTLADFYKHDYFVSAEPENDNDKIGNIIKKQSSGGKDFSSTIRGIRKNLILLDIFVFERKFEVFFQRTQDLLKKSSEKK